MIMHIIHVYVHVDALNIKPSLDAALTDTVTTCTCTYI